MPVTKANKLSIKTVSRAAFVAGLLVLGGCESLTGPGGIFGDTPKTPLPGERISV